MSEQQRKQRLAFFPINFFPVVMGLCGFALALKQTGEVYTAQQRTLDAIAYSVSWLALGVFIVLLGFYFAKIIKHTDRVFAELDNHMLIGFFAAIPISMLLLAACLAEAFPVLSQGMWVIGATVLLMMAVMIVNRWMYHQNVTTEHVTPVWFIPVVGTILVPVTGMDFAPKEFSWMFFSIGVFFWLLVFVLVMFRLLFERPMPLPMAPSMFILLAPPAVGFLSWTTLVGELDALAHLLYYVAVFILLLLVVELPGFARLKFSLGSWAYSFPLAAMTTASFKMYALNEIVFLSYFSWALLGLLTVVILWLTIATILAIARGAICLPPPNVKN